MNRLTFILREAVAIVIDDGAFALAIVVWLAITAALVRFAPAAAHWAGALLFAGLAVILAESTTRRARK